MSKIYVDEIAGIASADTVAIPGHVIQVVQDTSTAFDTTTSATYVNTSLSGTITPTSSTSKILVMFSASAGVTGANACLNRMLRGATPIWEAGVSYTGGIIFNASSFQILDTPATTTATTYTVQYCSQVAGQTAYFNVDYGGGFTGETATITLMEIAG